MWIGLDVPVHGRGIDLPHDAHQEGEVEDLEQDVDDND